MRPLPKDACIVYITTNGIAQPWVGNELRVVGEKGVPYEIHSMRPAGPIHFKSEWAERIDRNTKILYPLPVIETAAAVLLGPFRFGRGYFRALRSALFGKREHLRARAACLFHFVAACVWATRIRNEPVEHIHSQWAHSGATIGLYASMLLDRSFSFTGHAADLFRNRVALEDKIRHAAFIGCISEYHAQFYRDLGARDEQLEIVYCGIDTAMFTPVTPRSIEGAFRIRSAGRLVPKKGFRYLIEACALLRERGIDFHCLIGGSGELEASLRAQIAAAGLEGCVEMTGEPLAQEDLPEFMREADAFCLPCVWAEDQDVDGLPQLLVEAMASGIPSVSCPVTGIPDLVVDDRTGLLAPERDPVALADALEKLAQDESLRRRLSADGRAWVEKNFDISTSLDGLIDRFHRMLGLNAERSPNASGQRSAIPT